MIGNQILLPDIVANGGDKATDFVAAQENKHDVHLCEEHHHQIPERVDVLEGELLEQGIEAAASEHVVQNAAEKNKRAETTRNNGRIRVPFQIQIQPQKVKMTQLTIHHSIKSSIN